MATEKWLIDVNALLHENVWLCGGFVGDPYSNGYMDALDNVETVIREFPTVDAVEVVHGSWWETKHMIPTVVCSVCGGMVRAEYTHEYGNRRKYNFCPYCGAKMDGDWNG